MNWILKNCINRKSTKWVLHPVRSEAIFEKIWNEQPEFRKPCITRSSNALYVWHNGELSINKARLMYTYGHKLYKAIRESLVKIWILRMMVVCTRWGENPQNIHEVFICPHRIQQCVLMWVFTRKEDDGLKITAVDKWVSIFPVKLPTTVWQLRFLVLF